MAETVELLERGIYAVFLAGVSVVMACVVTLVAAGTYGMIHKGNDFPNLGDGSGRGGDIIVLPAQPF